MFKFDVLNNHCSNCNLKFSGFESLSDDELTLFKESHCKVEYNRGETIIKQGARCSNLVCIKEGFVKIHVAGMSSRSMIISILKPGDFIINPGVFDDNRNHFSASAITGVSTCLISIDAFSEIFHRNNKFAEAILKHNHRIMQTLYTQLLNLSQKKMTGRVADTLLYLSNDVYQSNAFYTTLSRQDMADLSSVSKESLIRILKDFKDSGIIFVEGNQFKIQATKTLQKISQAG